MIQKVYVVVLLLGSIITATGHRDPKATKKIFQHPQNSDVSQIKGTSTPWVIPRLIPIIQEFKKNVFEDFKSSPNVKKVWDMKSESKDSRNFFFNDPNKLLDDLGYPLPAALANIVSKSASLFEPLNMTTFFENVAINLAEFLLSRNIKIERETATRYADTVSKELESADPNDQKTVWQGALRGYSKFVESYGFKIADVIGDLLLLFASELIVLHDK